jgi:uncharacterized protein
VVDDSVQVFDCVEFDPALRRVDVGADIAFLVMELHASGAERLSDALMRAYRLAGGDPGDHALLSFYAAYRALVRATLHYMEAAELPAGHRGRGEALGRAEELLALAERFGWRARLPLVLVVCGVTATGKTTVAQSIAAASGLCYFGSDLTRKRLAGVAPTERAPAEAYTDESSHRTYATLGRLAREALEREGGAVVNGTFRRLRDRDSFREGLRTKQDASAFLECLAPTAVLAERAERREPRSASDATVELVREQLEEFAPLDEVPPGRHLVLRTDRPVAETLGDVQALLDSRLVGREKRSSESRG